MIDPLEEPAARTAELVRRGAELERDRIDGPRIDERRPIAAAREGETVEGRP